MITPLLGRATDGKLELRSLDVDLSGLDIPRATTTVADAVRRVETRCASSVALVCYRCRDDLPVIPYRSSTAAAIGAMTLASSGVTRLCVSHVAGQDGMPPPKKAQTALDDRAPFDVTLV